MSEFMMKTVFIKDILREDFLGKEVDIKGWVYRMRDMKDKIFFVIRDSTGIIQAVVKKENVDQKTWEDATKFQIEGSLEVKGILIR